MILISNEKKGRTLRRTFCVILAAMMALALIGLFASRVNAADSDYTITVESTDTSAGSVSGGKNVPQGDSVTLSATPNTGYRFTYWTNRYGQVVSVDLNYSFVPEESGKYFAWFEDTTAEGLVYSGTVSSVTIPEASEGYGTIESQVMKINNTGTGKLLFRLFDISISGANPDAFEIRSYFSNGVSGGCYHPNDDVGILYIKPVSGLDVGTYTAKVTIKERDGKIAPLVGNISFTVTTDYVISAYLSPTEGGSVSGSGTYTSGHDVTLTATPNTKYRFVGWYEGAVMVSDDAEYTFTATGARELVAKFEQSEFDIDVDIYNPEVAGSSTVTGAGTYYKDDTVTIVATPDFDVVFSKWLNQYGQEVSTSATYSFTASEDIKMFAVFREADIFYITFNTNGGNLIATQTVYECRKANKPSDPTKTGFVFDGWYSDYALTKPFDFSTEITSDYILYAKWKEEPTTPTPKPTITDTPTPPITPEPTKPDTPTPGPVTPSPSPDDTVMSFEDFVERLYTVALGRASEPEGKAFWCEHVGNGDLDGAQCAKEFLLSKEFNDRGLDDKQFLEVLYKTFFNRDATEDPDGFNFWMNSLKTQGRDVVVDCFINSEEWCNVCASYGVKSGATRAKATAASDNATKFATRLYTECLGRDPEEGGLKFWSLGLTNLELTGKEAAHEFFFSKEFNDHNYDEKELLTRMYRTFMGREPDDDGMNFWLNNMKNGMTKEDVFNEFVKSPEFTQICKDYAIERG